MKVNLPCCDINKKSRTGYLQCRYCECFFKNYALLDGHYREIHKKQIAVKRKKICCHSNNKKKRRKTDHHHCLYCERVFPQKIWRNIHVDREHKCETCHGGILCDDVRDHHAFRHNQEEQLEELQELRQFQLDDDFVFDYVKANKLDEYQPQPDYKPNFDYIMSNYEISDIAVLLKFLKKFKCTFLDYMFEHYKAFDNEKIIYLAENGALSCDDVADFLDCALDDLIDDDVYDLVLYLLGEEYKMRPTWVARVIFYGNLVKRIKQKNTFTFDEIYEAIEMYTYVDDVEMQRRAYLYRAIFKHFPRSRELPERRLSE